MNTAAWAFDIDRKMDGHGELVSAAYIGIMEAMNSYKPDAGASLFTHCYWRGRYAAMEERRPRRLRRGRTVPLAFDVAERARLAGISRPMPSGYEGRQADIAELLARGLNNLQIATSLGLSTRTIEYERAAMRELT